MMKCRMVILFVTMAAFVGLAAAQNSKVGLSSTPTAKDPLKTATKPLTPKSAIQPHSKSSAPLPNASANSRKTDAELTRLEHQSVKASGPKSGNTAAAKSAPVKPISPPATSGSGINATYQKPRVPQRN
jgi:hypothetical protein